MNFANLKTTLKTVVFPAYLIYGSDIYLVHKAVELITEAAGVQDAQLDVSTLTENASAEAIVAECRTVSFFGGKRVVIVRPATAAQFTKVLTNYLSSPNPDCVLILVFSNEKNTTSLKNIEPVDCNTLPSDLIVKLIANQLNASGKKITTEAANLLCAFCGNNYAKIDNELNKLVNYFTEKEILEAGDVTAIAARTEEYQIYELGNALAVRNIAKSEEILKALQAAGIEDYAIFGNIVSSFRRLFYALTCKSSNETVAGFLKCSPYAILCARRDNRGLTSKIASIYEQSLELEYKIKSGKVSVSSAITQLQMIV